MTGVVAPRVSIGIPAYARPVELVRAISSVLAQDVPEVEVVVGDDSGDLEGVVRAIDDPRVVYVRNETRLGMAGNWNAVLDRCRAPLVGLLMDDDELLPGFVRAVTQAFGSEPDLGLVFTDHLFSDGGRTWPRTCALPDGRYDDFLVPLLQHRPVAVSAAVMRREVWEQVGAVPDLLTADMVMHLRIALAGYAVRYVDRPLMTYAVHPGQQSAASPRFRRDQVSAWEMFVFDDPVAERLRRRLLARACVSVAAAEVGSGELVAARASLSRARDLGLRELGLKGVVLLAAVSSPGVARVARSSQRWRGLVRTPSRTHTRRP